MARQKSQVAAGVDNSSAEVDATKIVSGKTALGGGSTFTKPDGGIDVTEMLKLINTLQETIQKMQEKEVSSAVAEKRDDEDVFEDIDIRQDEYIRVISLTPLQLNLSTRPGGKGKVFTFNSFGATKRILYSDLVDILESFSHFLEGGYFYIADKRVIRRHGLDDVYEKILSKDKIEAIISGQNNDNTISLFKSANETQQKTIIQMLIDKMIVEYDAVDLNLIDKLSRTSGINIEEKYRDAKAYVDSNKRE